MKIFIFIFILLVSVQADSTLAGLDTILNGDNKKAVKLYKKHVKEEMILVAYIIKD